MMQGTIREWIADVLAMVFTAGAFYGASLLLWAM